MICRSCPHEDGGGTTGSKGKSAAKRETAWQGWELAAGWYKTGVGVFEMPNPKISKQKAVVQGGWVLCPVTWAKIGALEKGAAGNGVAPFCRKCGEAHPVYLSK